MPYKIESVGGGSKVINQATGATYSNHPQTHAKALAQLRAIEVNTHGEGSRKARHSHEQEEGMGDMSGMERVTYCGDDAAGSPCHMRQYDHDQACADNRADMAEALKMVGHMGNRRQYEMAFRVCQARRRNGKGPITSE